jgi:hypothetical protein
MSAVTARGVGPAAFPGNENRLFEQLTILERRRVALASLALLEQQCVLRLAQIRADRRALLAQGRCE